jgi:hypothetical protein
MIPGLSPSASDPFGSLLPQCRYHEALARAMLVQLQLGPNPRSPWPGEFAVGQAHQAAISMPITAMTLAAMAARCGLIAQYAGCAIATSIGRA